MRTRRRLLATVGAGIAAGVAGCSNNTDSKPRGNSTSTSTDTPELSTSTESQETTNQETDPQNQEPQTFDEHYTEWIHGEDEEILEQAQNQISFNDINQALEQGNTRVEKVAQAVGEAAKQYNGGNQYSDEYSQAHRTALSAVHQTLQQKTDTDFNLYSNINLGGASSPFEFSEIMVETEDGDYETLIGQFVPDANRDNQKPSQSMQGSNRDIQVYRPEEHIDGIEGALKGLGEIDYTAATHVQGYPAELDVRNAEGELTDEQWGSWMEAFGYAIIGGGHSVNRENVEFMPNHKILPESKEAMTVVYEALHGDGDFEDYRNLNEAYLNSNFADEDVYASAEWTGSDWNISSAEGWKQEDGFSNFAS